MCSSRKKNKIALFVMLLLFLFFNKVDASNCTRNIQNNLVKEAEKVEIVPTLNEEYNPMHVYKYNVYITNLSENVYIIDSNNNRYEYDEFQDEDSIFGVYEPGSKVVFNIYASINTECESTKLKSKTITFDFYNDYSTREECKGIEEFSLCKRNYNGKIESDEWFLEKVKEYRENNQEVVEDDSDEIKENEKNFLDQLKGIIKNPIVITFISIIIVVIIMMIIIKIVKNSKKIKIRYKEDKERADEYDEDEKN